MSGYGPDEQEWEPPVRRVIRKIVNGIVVVERVIGGKAGGDSQRVGQTDAPSRNRAG